MLKCKTEVKMTIYHKYIVVDSYCAVLMSVFFFLFEECYRCYWSVQWT